MWLAKRRLCWTLRWRVEKKIQIASKHKKREKGLLSVCHSWTCYFNIYGNTIDLLMAKNMCQFFGCVFFF